MIKNFLLWVKVYKKQHKKITDIKVANRKMVEIIKNIKELNKNVNLSFSSENEYLIKEYDKFRRKLIKVLRVIYLFRTKDDVEIYADKLSQLKKNAKDNIRKGNKSIDKIIRQDLITPEMASSLFNDYSNVNDVIKKMIEVAELLYDDKDSLFDNGTLIKEKKAV